MKDKIKNIGDDFYIFLKILSKFCYYRLLIIVLRIFINIIKRALLIFNTLHAISFLVENFWAIFVKIMVYCIVIRYENLYQLS